MITLDDYFQGRRQRYAMEYTDQIGENARETVKRVNALLNWFYAERPGSAVRRVNSGWRPPSLNALVKRAAPNSRHMTGEACDLSDDDEELDKFLNTQRGLDVMATLGLWAESSRNTPRWCHVQTVAPGSGRRIFSP